MSSPQRNARGARSLSALDAAIVQCRACPRLVRWREQVPPRASYRGEDYWGAPVPGFGDPAPAVLVVGLAPGAHGANRTGRMFTGDRSGDFLFASLHRCGLAAQPGSTARGDGQHLLGTRITAAVHCAPPANRPDPDEIAACSAWLERELALVADTVRAVIALGGLAWTAVLRAAPAAGWQAPRPRPPFGHGREVRLAPGPILIGSYHPSQQNTFTGRLTEGMLDGVMHRAAALAAT